MTLPVDVPRDRIRYVQSGPQIRNLAAAAVAECELLRQAARIAAETRRNAAEAQRELLAHELVALSPLADWLPGVEWRVVATHVPGFRRGCVVTPEHPDEPPIHLVIQHRPNICEQPTVWLVADEQLDAEHPNWTVGARSLRSLAELGYHLATKG